MADWHFAKATTREELVARHDPWVADYNAQEHWAHRDRADDRRSPAEILGWVTGQLWALAEFQQIFATNRFGRRVGAAGYVRFRRWRIYNAFPAAPALLVGPDRERMVVGSSPAPSSAAPTPPTTAEQPPLFPIAICRRTEKNP